MSAFPSTVTPKETTLTSNQPTFTTISDSGKTQSRINAGHLWNLKAVFPAMTRAQIAPLMAFANSLRGRFTSFTFVPKSHATPLGVATGAPLVVTPHSAGASFVVCDGFTPSITGIMKAGDVIKFDSHAKVYMITADANSSAGTGVTPISIVPPLIEDLADNEVITVNDVPFTVRFRDDPLEWKTNRQKHSTYTIDLIESL